MRFLTLVEFLSYSLLSRLRTMRESDTQTLRAAVSFVIRFVNHVPLPSTSCDRSFRDRLIFLLFREGGQETEVWIDYLIASLLSSKSLFDIQKLNPFITQSVFSSLHDIAVFALLLANRIGHINRCVDEIQSLLKLLIPTGVKVVSEEKNRLRAGLVQKGEALAGLLVAGRFYMDETMEGNDGLLKDSHASGQAPVVVYDPRFLVFEFTWNILLRRGQVEMVRTIYSSVKRGESIVKQMIMGAGKTTVVGPLLCLLLADGENLVVQAVPPALLEFTRSILRSTFSSIMQKRIFTLSFDRSCDPDDSIRVKLQYAERKRAVVVTTPTSLKSLMLKFLEVLHHADEGRSSTIVSRLRSDAESIRSTLMVLQVYFSSVDFSTVNRFISSACLLDYGRSRPHFASFTF